MSSKKKKRGGERKGLACQITGKMKCKVLFIYSFFFWGGEGVVRELLKYIPLSISYERILR